MQLRKQDTVEQTAPTPTLHFIGILYLHRRHIKVFHRQNCILASSHLWSVDHRSGDRCTVIQKCKNYICVSVCILQNPKTFRSLLATLFQLTQAICLVFLLHLVSLVMFTCTSGCLISLCKVLCTVHPISERASFCSLRDL